jgi:hypothetical protein
MSYFHRLVGAVTKFTAYLNFAPEPALNALWETQRVLTPLIRCMPEDLWVHEQDLKLVRSISQEVVRAKPANRRLFADRW